MKLSFFFNIGVATTAKIRSVTRFGGVLRQIETRAA